MFTSSSLEIAAVSSLLKIFHEFSETIEGLRKVQRPNYSKIAKVSLKPFNSSKIDH